MAASKTSFQPGNQAAVKHGLYSQVTAGRRAQLAAATEAQILAACPYLTDADGPALALAVDILSRRDQVCRHLDKGRGMVGRRGPKPEADLYIRLTSMAFKALQELGCTPQSRAQLLSARGSAMASLSAVERAREAQGRLRTKAEAMMAAEASASPTQPAPGDTLLTAAADAGPQPFADAEAPTGAA